MKHSIKIENSSYSDNEILWLIKNIGNKNPDIRDSLVYNILTTGITEEKFTTTQFYTIVQSTITNNLILFNIAEKLPSTLTRSFSALLNGNIIFADGNTKSKYYNSLSGEEKNYFFSSSITYLYSEHDYTGYSEKYGWVHSIAHGADFLSQALCHNLFPNESTEIILNSLEHIFTNMSSPFIDEEEKRIGNMIYQGITNDKIEINTLNNWISNTSFPLNNNSDFYRKTSFNNFLSYLYFKLKNIDSLDSKLAKIIETKVIS